MFSAATAELIVCTILLFLTYTISVVIIGYGQAYVARWAGDHTAEHAGFLTGHPRHYIDWFGFMCTLLIGFGWGRTLPFRPSNAREPHRVLRVLAVYLSQPAISLGIACVAFLINLMLIGPGSLCIALRYILLSSVLRTIPINILAQSAPGTSTAVLVLALLLITLISVNIFLAMWSLLHNICYQILFIGGERGYAYMQYAELLLIAGPLLLFLFFGPAMRLFFIQITASSAYGLAKILGVV